MKSKDQQLLEEAYDNVNEGIWDRLKGQGAGIAAGLKQGAQNLATGAANKLGANIKPSGQSMGQAYAKSQQKSIFSSFLQKAKAEIADFEADIQKLGKADIAALKASHPEIEQAINSYKKLMVYLGGQGANVNKIK
jgi:hypothetical protein